MIKIKIIDLNASLVLAAQGRGIDADLGEYFLEGYKEERPVFVTASNPVWTFGGGIDAVFKKHFPELVRYKQMKGGGMERIANVVFAITVDEHLSASKEKVKEAIEFAIAHTGDDETLILSGLGTGIGGMSVKEFIDIVKEVCPS